MCSQNCKPPYGRVSIPNGLHRPFRLSPPSCYTPNMRMFQSQTGSTGHSDRGTSSIAWEAKENKGLRGSLFWEVFWPNTERLFWGISSSSRFWGGARVHAQHSQHCDPRSTLTLAISKHNMENRLFPQIPTRLPQTPSTCEQTPNCSVPSASGAIRSSRARAQPLCDTIASMSARDF